MKYCHECGAKLEKKDINFCSNCGQSLNKVENKSNLKKEVDLESSKKAVFFNLTGKNGLVKSISLYLLILFLVFPSYFVFAVDDDVLIAILNFCLSVYVGFIFGRIKLDSIKLAIVCAIMGIIGSFAGTFGGLLPLVYIFNTDNKLKIKELSPEQTQLIKQLVKLGFVWYLGGILFTLGGLFIVDEGGTYYLWYGAVLVGMWKFIQASLFRYSPKDLSDEKPSKELTENEIKQIRKKETKKMFKWGLIITAFFVFLVIFGFIISL